MSSLRLRYVLCETLDPEERLEDAALWKALHDHYGDEIEVVTASVADGVPWFGRGGRFSSNAGQACSHVLEYWTDPAFLENCGRDFTTVGFENAGPAISRLHAAGKGAFLKSTRAKHYIGRVPVGADWREVVGDGAYSFIDGGPSLMVQELVEIEDEFRFFVIDREVVTLSENRPDLTPIGRSRPCPTGYMGLAERVARTMRTPHAVVDIGAVRGRPVAVEFNPMMLGGVGLFACNVAALARASEALLPKSPARPSMTPPNASLGPGRPTNSTPSHRQGGET